MEVVGELAVLEEQTGVGNVHPNHAPVSVQRRAAIGEEGVGEGGLGVGGEEAGGGEVEFGVGRDGLLDEGPAELGGDSLVVIPIAKTVGVIGELCKRQCQDRPLS